MTKRGRTNRDGETGTQPKERSVSGKRDEQIRRFADAVERGSVVHCSLSIYRAIQGNSEYVGKFAGCDVRASNWCAPGTMYAIMPDSGTLGKTTKVPIVADVDLPCPCCNLLSNGEHRRRADYWLVRGRSQKPRCAVHARAYPLREQLRVADAPKNHSLETKP